MRLQLKKTTGDFKGEKLPILIFFIGLLLVYAVHVFSTVRLELCLFRRVFGFYCPSCGITRAFIAAAKGDFLSALKHNPLMFIVTIIFFAYLFMQFIFKRTFALICSKKEQNYLFITFLILLLSNWLYVIFR